MHNGLDYNLYNKKFMAHKKKNINTNSTDMTDYMPVTQAASERGRLKSFFAPNIIATAHRLEFSSPQRQRTRRGGV